MSTDYYPSEINFKYQGTDYTIAKIHLQDARSLLNLRALFDRKRGDRFIVDEEGELRVAEGWKDWVYLSLSQNECREKVKEVIDNTLEQFNAFLSQYTDLKVAEAAVNYLFDPRSEMGIGRLGRSLYTHKLLHCENFLSKYLFPPNTVRLKFSDYQFVDITGKQFENSHLPTSPLAMDLGDEISNHNFWMLLKRKKKQIYRVNAEGKLEKIKRSWEYRQNQSECEQKVQAAVTDVIKKLNAYLAKGTASELHQLVIQRIFSSNIYLRKNGCKQEDSPVCRMNQNTFNRGAIEEGSCLESLLNPALEKKRAALIETLKEMRKAGTDAAKTAAKRQVEHAFMELVFEEFEFAQRLGIDLERSSDGGSGGARYAFDRFGRKILVIKPDDEGPLGVNNPQWYARIKRFLLDPKACLEGNPEQMAEYDSWLWDRNFDIWSVPPTDIRYVASNDFIGNSYKECSAQMFVADCETLGKYVDVSPHMHWLPRRFLRWYCGGSQDTGPVAALGERVERRNELLETLPVHSLERVAIQDMGTENLDRHFENILVKLKEISPEKTLLDRIFEGDESVIDDEIVGFVNTFFSSQGNQELLEKLFFSEEVTINGVTKKISLINIDEGASNPHSHPSWWDYLSLRYKHLFEVLPHFEYAFTPKGKALIENKENIFAKFLFEKAVGNLRGVLTPEVFERFWDSDENRTLFNQWVFEMDPDKEYHVRLRLIPELFAATQEKAEKGPDFQFYFIHHLERIHGNLQTRVDSFRVLEHYVKSDNHAMRDVFKDVKSADDFERELKGMDNSYKKIMNQWKERDVKIEVNPKRFSRDLKSS